jgi:glycosyltransferase involved in cell wall biosynthesis
MTQSCEQQTGRDRARVMVLIPGLDIGGAETDLLRNLPLVDRSRFEIIVCAFLVRGALADALQDAGIEVIGPIQVRRIGIAEWLRQGSKWRPLAAARRLARRIARRLPGSVRRTIRKMLLIGRQSAVPVAGALAYLRIAAAVAQQFRERDIDLVHAILPSSYIVGTIACKLAGRQPLIMSRLSLNWYQDRLFRALESYAHRFVKLAICNSTAIREQLLSEGLPAARIGVIPNGIDVREFSPCAATRQLMRDRLGLAPQALVLTLVANLHRYKGHHDLLQALRLVRDHLPADWALLAAGRDVDGNLRELIELRDRLGLAGHVHFLGERRDVAAILRCGDIHLSASHTEGFPNNVLEAMSVGLPVIATAVGGVAEMVVDGVTAMLVPARNPYEMARALRQLVSEPERRRAMGEAGRARAAALFSVERSADALQAAYATSVTPLRPVDG